jgi:hypothetical protein
MQDIQDTKEHEWSVVRTDMSEKPKQRLAQVKVGRAKEACPARPPLVFSRL